MGSHFFYLSERKWKIISEKSIFPHSYHSFISHTKHPLYAEKDETIVSWASSTTIGLRELFYDWWLLSEAARTGWGKQQQEKYMCIILLKMTTVGVSGDLKA